MGIVVGFGTLASLDGVCAVSANWNANPNSQRLFCLDGKFTPAYTIKKPTQTASLTLYAPGPSHSVAPSTSCETLDSVCDAAVVISPSACDSDVTGYSGNMMVTSYSYSKEDTTLPGQESWSLQTFIGDNLPSHIIRGISEGTATDENVCGIQFSTTDFSASAGNVSSGGLGRADTMTGGIVSAVGGGQGIAGNDTGQGSASIPYTPLWLE